MPDSWRRPRRCHCAPSAASTAAPHACAFALPRSCGSAFSAQADTTACPVMRFSVTTPEH